MKLKIKVSFTNFAKVEIYSILQAHFWQLQQWQFQLKIDWIAEPWLADYRLYVGSQ
jgi:hypothetical protein